ncbi:MAG: hypothetical protein IJS84_09295 [Spirochaetales bacterium]|nr:hypothetical protein [Spirochaetales bacterium]
MAVNVGQRHVPDTPANRRCDAVDACFRLCSHTLKVTSNVNIFVPEHQDLTLRIRELALDIYDCAYWANKTVVTNAARWQVRNENQTSAFDCLNRMLGMILLAKVTFHLRSRKSACWVQMIKDARSLVKAWHDSDVKSYQPLYGEC